MSLSTRHSPLVLTPAGQLRLQDKRYACTQTGSAGQAKPRASDNPSGLKDGIQPWPPEDSNPDPADPPPNMSQSSGILVGKMKWLVTRYPKPPGQTIVLGAILTDPEDPESRLNWNTAVKVDKNLILDESTAVQRTIQAEAVNANSFLLKVAQPLLGAGLSIDGKLARDRKTVVDALDVRAKIFLPTKAFMDGSVEDPNVQDYVSKSHFSKPLYMIIGVASANKLSVDEETSKQGSAGSTVSASHLGGPGAEVAVGIQHDDSQKATMGLKIEEECDFAYRIREFTFWKHRTSKVKMKGDRSKGALFGVGNGDSEDDDDDEEDFETVAVYNSLKDHDVDGSASGLSTLYV